jgi:class 3 adenylate cyclase/tetratricopeptide (TPR) repeat protein
MASGPAVLAGSVERPRAAAYLPRLLLGSLAEAEAASSTSIEPLDGTLMFADISGFTALSEKLAAVGKEGAEWLTNIINGFFERLLGIANELGGDNLKFGGDALLLFFSGEGHAQRAVASGLEMQRSIQRHGLVRLEAGRVRLSMSIGIHSARFWGATAGDPALRMQHLILGEDGATLAKVEGAASHGEVLITAETKALLGAGAELIPRDDGLFLVRRVTPPRVVPRDGPGAAPLASAARIEPYLPPHLRGLEPADSAIENEGEHRKVCVIFIALRGLNEYLTEAGPGAALAELDAYVRLVVHEAERFGGYVVSNDIDSHGQKLIVIFGAPVAHEGDEANAFRFALSVAAQTPALGLHANHRMGINVGYVFCGDLGASFRREYTVLGDDVNLSARLMAAAGPEQILVSEKAAAEAGPGFVARSLTPIKVKGKSQPIEIRELLAEQSHAGPAAERQRSPLVGRDAEMATLAALIQEAEGGKGGSLVVVSEAGAGKTRILTELLERQRERGWTILRGDCYPHSASMPFGPWLPVLERLLALEGKAGAAERTERAVASIEGLAPLNRVAAPLLNALLGLEIPANDVVNSLDEEGRREQLRDLVAALLGGASAREPISLVFEDIQWADGNSRWLIDHVARRAEGLRLLMAVTSRTDPAFVLPPESMVVMTLAPLGDDAALDLLRYLLGMPDLAAETAEPVLAKCRGNPLFLEEVARALRPVPGAPARHPSTWADFAVPDRLQSLLLSRIDTLEPGPRHMLRLASVIGTTFELSTLRALARRDGSTGLTEIPLLQLVEGEFVHVLDPFEARFQFGHNLLREVAYETLLFARRRELHNAVGDHIETTRAHEVEAHYETLAHHYVESANVPKAVTYSVRAGDKARRVFASEGAIAYYQAAMGMLARMPGDAAAIRSAVSERIGDAYEAIGREGEAVHSFSRALHFWLNARQRAGRVEGIDLEVPGGEEREATLRFKIAVAHERNSSYTASLRWCDRALRSLPRGHPTVAARILGARSVAFFRRGRYEQAILWGRRALAAARRAGQPAELAYAHHVLANAYDEAGRLRISVRHRTAALELYEQLGDLPRMFAAHGNLGLSYQSLGQLDLALEHDRACLDLAIRVGNMSAAAIANNNLGEVLLMKGEVEAAAPHFRATIDAFRERRELAAVAGLAMVNLSRVLTAGKDLEAAQVTLDEGAELLRAAGARGLLIEAGLQQGELALVRGDLNLALRTAQRTLQEARDIGMQLGEARVMRLLGTVLGKLGRLEEAESQLRANLRAVTRLGARYEVGLSLLALAEVQVAAAAGAFSEAAVRSAGKAAAVFEAAGAAGPLATALELTSSASARLSGRRWKVG